MYLHHHNMDILAHWTLSFLYIYRCYTNTVTLALLFHVHIPLIHGYTILLDTIISYICIAATRILCTQLFYVLLTLLHRFTCIYVLIIYVFLLHESLFLLYGYSCILITWLYSVKYVYDIPVTGHECCWYAMCGTKCHMDLRHGGYL